MNQVTLKWWEKKNRFETFVIKLDFVLKRLKHSQSKEIWDYTSEMKQITDKSISKFRSFWE